MDDAEALKAPPLPPLVSKEEISRRLRLIYPEGLENREHVMKPTTAATVFTALYIGSVASKKGKSNRWLAPRHVVRMTDDIAADRREEARYAYPTRTPPSSNNSWYADNSRETIRDESIRQGLIQLNGMIKRSDVKTSSGAGRYALCDHFVALFDPDLEGDEMIERIAEWQKGHLAVSALMRSEMAKTTHGHAVVVAHPSSQGGTTVLPFGESPAITKAVVEEFAPRFMGDPVVLWISDSEKRVIDDKLVKRLKIPISAEKMLPDVVLADIEGDKIKIVLGNSLHRRSHHDGSEGGVPQDDRADRSHGRGRLFCHRVQLSRQRAGHKGAKRTCLGQFRVVPIGARSFGTDDFRQTKKTDGTYIRRRRSTLSLRKPSLPTPRAAGAPCRFYIWFNRHATKSAC